MHIYFSLIKIRSTVKNDKNSKVQIVGKALNEFNKKKKNNN